MPLYFFAWLALVAYSTVEVLEKAAIKYLIKNPWLYSFLTNLFALILLLPIVAFKGFGAVHDWPDIFMSAVLWALGNILFFLAIYYVDISILSPAFNLKSAFALLLGFLFLGEKLSGQQGILVAVIFIAGIFVSFDEKLKFRAFLTKPMLIVFFEMFVLAAGNVFTHRALVTTDFWSVSFWVQLLAVIFLLPTIYLFKNEVSQINFKQAGTCFLLTILSTLGILAVTKAVTVGIGIPNVILAIPLSMVMVAISSFFWPKFLEHHSTKIYIIRFAAAAVMFIAAVKLSI